MKRRKFITLLGGAVAGWPLTVRGQQPAMPVIGFLRDTSLADATYLVAAFRQGLKEAGFIEGQNVAIEYRSAEDQPHRLSALVADLVRRFWWSRPVSRSRRSVSKIGLRFEPQQRVSLNEKSVPKDTCLMVRDRTVKRYFSNVSRSAVLVLP